MNARVLILCLLAVSVARAADLRLELAGDAVATGSLADGSAVRTWSWGVLVTAADLPLESDPDGLAVPLQGDVTVHGPRDGRGKAPLLLLADGLTLAVDGDVSVSTRDGDTVIGPPGTPMNPGAAVAIFLAMLILTALMLRQTRKSIARR